MTITVGVCVDHLIVRGDSKSFEAVRGYPSKCILTGNLFVVRTVQGVSAKGTTSRVH